MGDNAEIVILYGQRGLLLGREMQGTLSSAVLAGDISCNYELAQRALIQQGHFGAGQYVLFKNCLVYCRSVVGRLSVPITHRLGFMPLW